MLCANTNRTHARTQHGTNKHGLKMMLWVTVDGSGATKILACSLLLDESSESAVWAARCFLDCFRVAPLIVFSDCAPQLKVAVAAVFPDAKHLYCIWHLSKNMMTNLRPACGGDDALWHRVSSMWWKIAKQSDSSSRATFDAEWAALGALLDESTAAGPSMDTARAWLAKMALEREHWAYRFTWQYVTLGLHSTQRIEAVHSAISHFLRASTLLTLLLPQLESYSLDVSVRASVRDYRFIQRLLAAADQMAPHPFITAMTPVLTAYALVLLKSQLQQAMQYVATPIADADGVVRSWSISRRPDTWGLQGDAEAQGDDADLGLSSSLFSVVRVTTLDGCSCQYLTCYGMPCRHMLYLYVLQQLELRVELFDARWKQRSDAAKLAAEQALLLRRPQRAPGGAAALPDRSERFHLIMHAARDVAQVGAESAGSFSAAMGGLAQLLSSLRQTPAAAGAAAPARRARAPARAAPAALPAGDAVARPLAAATAAAAAAAAAGEGGPVCRACWQPGHYRSNRKCSRFGKEPLPRPSAHAPPRAIARKRGGEHLLSDAEEEEEEAEEEVSVSQDGNDNACHLCSEPGELLECDACPRSWHSDCLPPAALAPALLEADPWLCPVCTRTPRPATFVGNPQRAPPGRGGGQHRSRLRPAAEGTKRQRREAKAAGRSREQRFR